MEEPEKLTKLTIPSQISISPTFVFCCLFSVLLFPVLQMHHRAHHTLSAYRLQLPATTVGCTFQAQRYSMTQQANRSEGQWREAARDERGDPFYLFFPVENRHSKIENREGAACFLARRPTESKEGDPPPLSLFFFVFFFFLFLFLLSIFFFFSALAFCACRLRFSDLLPLKAPGIETTRDWQSLSCRFSIVVCILKPVLPLTRPVMISRASTFIYPLSMAVST